MFGGDATALGVALPDSTAIDDGTTGFAAGAAVGFADTFSAVADALGARGFASIDGDVLGDAE